MFKKISQQRYCKLIDGVDIGTVVHGEKTLMARFRLAKGGDIPSHSHPHEQTGLLISGHIVLTIDGTEHDVMPGDGWCIGADVPHAARAIEESMAVEVFTPVREDYLEKD